MAAGAGQTVPVQLHPFDVTGRCLNPQEQATPHCGAMGVCTKCTARSTYMLLLAVALFAEYHFDVVLRATYADINAYVAGQITYAPGLIGIGGGVTNRGGGGAGI